MTPEVASSLEPLFAADEVQAVDTELHNPAASECRRHGAGEPVEEGVTCPRCAASIVVEVPRGPYVLVTVRSADDDGMDLRVRGGGLPDPADAAGILCAAVLGLAQAGDESAREIVQPELLT